MTGIEVKTLIGEHLMELLVIDTKGNGSHFKVVIVSPQFEGKA